MERLGKEVGGVTTRLKMEWAGTCPSADEPREARSKGEFSANVCGTDDIERPPSPASAGPPRREHRTEARWRVSHGGHDRTEPAGCRLHIDAGR